MHAHTAPNRALRKCRGLTGRAITARVVASAHQSGQQDRAWELSRREALLAALAAPMLLQGKASAFTGTVFVAGSTGGTGRRVVAELRKQGLPVRAGVRDPKKGLSLGFGADSGIEIVIADVTKGVGPLEEAIGGAAAVICCTGAVGFGPNGSTQVDEVGVKNLVDAANKAGVQKFVLLSSLLTNAPAVGQADNPNYKFLNVFGGVLDHKLAAEKYLRASGLDYTIVRPGGLSNEFPAKVGNLIVAAEDTFFGLATDPGRAISRDTVAEVLVQAVLQPAASNKLVEVVASPAAPALPSDAWFQV